jgi:hypothetical protein
MTFVVTIFSFKKTLLINYANFFIINDAKKNADLILILSGNVLTRAPHAANLIKDGYSSRVMITNMKWHQLPFGLTYPSDIQMAKTILGKYNLNNELEILPSLKSLGASSTFDEAYDLRDYLLKNKLKNIILVTDENHSRRALMAFKKIINNLPQVNITVSSAPNEIYNKRNWWKSDLGLKTYILELFLYVYYYLYNDNIRLDKNV